MHGPRLLLALLALVTTVLVIVLLTRPDAALARVDEPPTEASDSARAVVAGGALRAEVVGLTVAIEELGTKIERLEAGLADVLRQLDSARDPARSAVGLPEEHSSAPELEQELRRLSEDVEQLHEALRDRVWLDRPPSLDEIRAGKDTTDWAGILELAARYEADPESALGSVRFLTYAEVLERLGPPTSMLADGTWWYEVPRATESDERVVLILRFLNTYVVGLKASR